MDAPQTSSAEEILILEGNPSILKFANDIFAEQYPQAKVSNVCSLEQCKQVVAENDFDIIILDCDINELSRLGLVHYLRVKDKEPAVLLISEVINPDVVNDMNALNCHRYLHKTENWFSQLGPAIRQLMRIKKLEDENRRLVAQLTEAKMFLEEKNQRLDEFSATVAHDIRGPLGSISMRLEYAMDKYGKTLDDRFKTLLGRCFDSTRRLIDVVQAMYNYAKLGSSATAIEEIDLVNLLEEVVGDLSFDDRLDIKIGINDLPVIWGNGNLLRRVFINLINNAVKYSDKEEIIINITCSEIIERTIGKFAKITVSDNGPGIPKENLQEIFSMFKRGSNVSKKDEGLGVGLSVVQRIVELHYGEVSVESEVGKGACFNILLPVEKLDFLD
jgi:signal transduction histidine kinase